MNRFGPLSLVIPLAWSILMASGCSSAPESKMDSHPSAPAWIHQPPHSFDGETLTYIGIGEDRDQRNARPKAEAFALTNLANDCSFVPKQAQILPEDFQETAGILFRAYVRVSVGLSACEAARAATSAARVAELANSELSAQVDGFQKMYDPPEPVEAAPPSALPISDYGQYFVLRQSLALTKQRAILTPAQGADFRAVSGATAAVRAFEKSNPAAWPAGPAFSDNRPNALNHQPSALRDTVAERARIKSQYPDSPPPIAPKKSASSSRGRGGRHRSQTPAQPPADSSPPASQ